MALVFGFRLTAQLPFMPSAATVTDLVGFESLIFSVRLPHLYLFQYFELVVQFPLFIVKP